MKAGERIPLIKESAHLIARHPERDVQLILSQHGVDTTNTYACEDDLESYALDLLKDASDLALTDVHEYSAGEAALSPEPTPGDQWTTALPARVFISHVHHDKVFADDVKRLIASRYGTKAFVAHDDIVPSKIWRGQIKRALATCHYFVAILKYSAYHDSLWCDQEVGWALGRGIPILPVRPVGFDRQAARGGFPEEHQDTCLDKAPEAIDPLSPSPRGTT